ncbi:DUF4334 domain-containing protein [Arthrobacter sp. zg-Y20]|uniref:DUF4334 domain-containing protein n=2 Tax=Arthrobacter TaxID=1663 RepID=UPI001D132791|nr:MULTISPECIES: DUF4334 domain-containing protein [unclassified Arthrobacter]MCC3275866.1 DUF4334 domain-containing protein [Arthrobacter sp. zg-Y20]MDK1316023.1 DUF4334 domain-containing protein [Arthrobacter sp. zg.Y20]
MGEPRIDGPDLMLRELSGGTTPAQASGFFDSLPPVRVQELTGSWQGAEVPTSHPLDGVLTRLGWYGKQFDGPDDAHPLLFAGGDGGPFDVNPWFVPLGTVLRLGPLLRQPAAGRALRPLLQLVRTRKPRARLRMVEYRGVLSAAMVYDSQPIIDSFRRVSGNTLLGAMDYRGPQGPFMFTLRRSG